MCLLSYQGIWCALHWISGPLNTEIHKHNTDSSCIKQPFSTVRVICPYIEFGWLNQYFWISLGLATALSAFHPSTLLAVLIEIELNVNVFALDSPQTMFFAVFHLLFSFGLSSTKTIEQKKTKKEKNRFLYHSDVPHEYLFTFQMYGGGLSVTPFVHLLYLHNKMTILQP